jgi:hypothetical protein
VRIWWANRAPLDSLRLKARRSTFGIIWGSLIAQPGWKDMHSAYGHSFIFLSYVYSGSAITGMAIADQGFQNDEPLARLGCVVRRQSLQEAGPRARARAVRPEPLVRASRSRGAPARSVRIHCLRSLAPSFR